MIKTNRLSVYAPDPKDTPEVIGHHHNFLKPWILAELWRQTQWPLDWMNSASIPFTSLNLAHDSKYVADILDGLRDNGFQNRDPAVPRFDLWTAGALVAAAAGAIENHGIRFVLGKMGHHAHHSLERGYCTFHNGLVAGEILRQSSRAKIIGILDYDFHEGDGTNHIIKTHQWKHYVHYSAAYEYSKRHQAEVFLEEIPAHISKFKTCDVIIYHCGVDAHVDDQVGGWLTTEQLHRREYLVFYHALKMKIPLVYCLGGGYQRDAQGNVNMDKILLLHTKSLLAYFDALTTIQMEGTLEHSCER